ncbi:MAG: two-component regulator propeller domain-containing protein [Acidobacteriaceae bacterium]
MRVDTVAIMIRDTWRWGGVCILLLAWTHAAMALDPQRSLEHFGHQAWRSDSGLPQNTVHAILQTRDGYLWLGTDGGLVRFDGMDLVTFDAENTRQLKSDTVYDLLQDESGALWISTAAGLLRYHDGGFTAFTAAQGLPADTVWFSHQDQRHRLWAITAAGPAWFNGKGFVAVAGAQSAGPLHRHALAEDAHGTLWLGGSSGVLALDTTLATPRLGLRLLEGVPVETVELDRKGALWIGSSEGLHRYAQGVLVPVLHLPGKTEVTALYPDAEDGMWVGTATGMLHIAKDGTRLALKENGPARVDSLYQDREHVLWMATERGVFRLEGDQLQSFAPGSPLAVNRVLSMYEDREGDLWLGTDSGGLHVLRDQKFTTYTTADGLSGNLVRCVFASAKGELWIGTDGAGLNHRTHSGFAHYSTAEGLSSNVILSLAGGAGDDLWIGTPNGLNLLHQGKVKRFTSADGLPDDFIRSLYTDSDGSLWIGTRHGLAHLSGDRFTNFSSMDGLGSDFIGALLRSGGSSLSGPLSGPRSGPLWIGTSAGLSRLENDTFTNATVQQGLSSNTVTAIDQDTQGTLWLGTNGGGLNRLSEEGKIRAFPYSSQGLPGTIYGVLEDGAGRLWLSSKTGIFRVSISALNAYLSGAAHALAVEAYGMADGMNIRECSGGGHPAAWKLADGSLWFATLDGVSFIDPAHAPENRVPPPVEIETVLVDDQVRSLHGELTIKPGANRLEIRYAGLSFVAPQKVEYRYQLQGFDHGWIDAGTRRAAFYTNLPPGSYRFRVLATNNDGVWNTTGAAFGLRMLPHYYQTWWFYSALALALLVLGYLVYRWRVLAVEAQWTAVLRERGRIAREIHDTLAQGFVGVSVQLELVARLLAGSRDAAPKSTMEPVVEQLDQARALVRASLAEARTSIWDLRSGAAGAPNPASIDQPEDLPSRLRRSCTRLAGGSATKVYLQVKGTYRPVSPKIEEELLRIGQEAVANAVRHASATRIDVQLVYASARVSLRVEDDGRGFTPGTDGPEGHYGIRGMQERAGEIDAALSLESTVGEGTRVSVEAPLA